MNDTFLDELIKVSAMASQKNRATQESNMVRVTKAFREFWEAKTLEDSERGLVAYSKARGFLAEAATGFTEDNAEQAYPAYAELHDEDMFSMFDYDDKRLFLNRKAHLKEMKQLLAKKKETA